MKGRQFFAFARALVLALPLGCQGGDQKGGTPSPPAGSKLAGKSFDAEEFACTPAKKSQVKGKSAQANKSKAKKDTAKAALWLQANNAAPVWKADIQTLLKDNCLPCHAANATAPDLSSFATASATADDNLERMQRTGAGLMPPAGALPAADIQRFSAWIAAGKPESAAAGGSDSGSADPDENENSQNSPSDEEGDEDEEASDEDSDEDESSADDEQDQAGSGASKKPLCPNVERQRQVSDKS